MLISPRNTSQTDTLRNIVLPAFWATFNPVKLVHIINHHKWKENGYKIRNGDGFSELHSLLQVGEGKVLLELKCGIRKDFKVLALVAEKVQMNKR